MANQGSWPSIAFIRWNFKANYRLPTGLTVTYTSPTYSCDGTLISTRKILTAGNNKKEITFIEIIKIKLFSFTLAHCIPTTIRFTFEGVSYTFAVTPNSYYPTYGSMFSVYLGLHDKTSIENSGTYSAPTIKVDVAEQRIVRNKNFYIFKFLT